VTSIVASALGVVAGVCFGVGALHLFIAMRRPRGGTHLTFALMSLLLGGYALAAIGNYQATSVEALATATRQQLTLLLLATAVFIWFVSFYTGVRPLPFLLAMTGVYLVLLAANLTSSFGLLYSDISGLVSVLLPWGERIVLPKGTASLWQFLCVLANAAVLGFAFYASFRQYRRGERGPALALGLSMLVLVVAAFHDTLVDAQVITSMYLLEFGYLALVATMSLSLSGRVVRAEEELQAYHQHMEELVEERTAELTAANERLQREIAERLQVEEMLRKSEERYRFLIEKQGEGIAAVDPDERFTFCNPMAESIFGVPSGTLVGRSLQEFTSPEAFETVRKQTEGRRAGERGAYELEIVRQDGEKRRLFITVTPWLDGDGHFAGAFGVVRDDTERVRAEELLRESEAQLLDLYEGAPNAYFSIGTDGLIRRCNRRAGELFGYPVEELVGRPVLELYADTPQGKEKASAVFQRFIAGERVTDEELQVQKADGTPIWISLTVNAVRDADGQVVESRSMVVDITERKQVEEALRISKERYEMATQAAKVGVWDWNLQSGEFYLDPNLKALLGYGDEEIPNDIEVWTTYVHPDDRQPVMEAAQAHIEGRTPEYIYEHRMRHKDGSVRWILVRGTAIRDEQGNVIRLVGTDVDITERKRAEEALRYERDNLARVIEAMADGVYIVNQQYDIQYVNPVLVQDFGPYQGRKCYAYFHDREEVCPWCKNQDVFAGKTVQWEWYSLKNQRTYDLIDTPLRDADGNILKLEILRDITERKRAEEELRKLSRAIEQSPGTVAITDAQGNVEYVNPKFTQLTGYTLEEVLGQNPRLLKSGEQPEEFYRDLWDTILAGEEWQGEFSNRKKSGETYWELASISAIRDADGVITHFVKVAEDITERKRTEEALRRRVGELITLNRIAQTVATVTDLPAALAIVAETVTHLLDATATVIASLDGDRMEVLGQFAHASGSPGMVGQVFPLGGASLVHQMLDQGEPLVVPDVQSGQFPLPLRERLRALGVHSVLVVPLRARGVIIGVMGVGTDQVDRVFTETEMALAGTIAGDVAGAIENARLYEQAQAVAIDGERRRLARELHDSVTQSLYSLTLLTNGWGAMAEQGRLENTPDSFRQLGDVALQALKEMRLLIHELRPTVLEEAGLVGALRQRLDTVEERVSVETRLLIQGEVDHLPRAVEEELFHIAQEALNNALRHAGATAITVRIEAQDEQVILSVQDDGMGFDSTLDSAGMGLTTMQERAEAIGGRVSITSVPQQGTTVEVAVAIGPDKDV